MPAGSNAPNAVESIHPAIIAMWHGEFMLIAPLAPKDFDYAKPLAAVQQLREAIVAVLAALGT